MRKIALSILFGFAFCSPATAQEDTAKNPQPFWKFSNQGGLDPSEYDWQGAVTRRMTPSDPHSIHSSATHDLLCASVRFKPAATCVGSRYFASLLITKFPVDRQIVYYSTGLRIQITQMNKLMGNYEYLIDHSYPQFNSMGQLIIDSDAKACLSYYDPRSRQDTAKAIICGYSWPERFSFVDWIEKLAPGLKGGKIFPKIKEIYKRYEASRCDMIVEEFDRGNRLATLSGFRRKEIPGASPAMAKRMSDEITALFRENPTYRDDMNFMLNALDGDCDRFYTLN